MPTILYAVQSVTLALFIAWVALRATLSRPPEPFRLRRGEMWMKTDSFPFFVEVRAAKESHDAFLRLLKNSSGIKAALHYAPKRVHRLLVPSLGNRTVSRLSVPLRDLSVRHNETQAAPFHAGRVYKNTYTDVCNGAASPAYPRPWAYRNNKDVTCRLGVSLVIGTL